jgi:hypothetical protein
MKNLMSQMMCYKFLSISAFVIAFISVLGSCVPTTNHDVTVQLHLPQSDVAKSNSVNAFANCNLVSSFVGAYNTNTGDVAISDVSTSVDPAAYSGIASGTSVLSFNSTPELKVKTGKGWNFYYFGSFGLTGCSTGPSVISFGEVRGVGISSETSIGLDVITPATSVNQDNLAAIPTGFTKVKFRWTGTGSTSCSSSGAVHLAFPVLNKAGTAASGISYNVTGQTTGLAELEFGPIPKNLIYEATVKQTAPVARDMKFAFGTFIAESASELVVNVPASAAGFCLDPATTAPAAPTVFSAVSSSSSQINLTWTDNSNNESGFKIERSTDNITFSPLVTTAANATSYSNTGLSSSTTYYYRINAYNGGGDSAYATSNATTSTPPASPPTAPSSLILGSVTSSSIQLNWTDNSSDETGFKIERSPDNSTWAQITTVSVSITTYTNTGLAPSTTYYYRVRAYNGGGDSAYTASASTATSAGGGPPTAPDPLVGMPDPMMGNNHISLTWTDVSGETGYEIERSTSSGVGFVQIATTGAGAASYTDTSALASTTYYYRVRATSGGGDSSYTTEQMVVNDGM